MPYLSIFTPTHDPRYLAETYFSLRHQDFQDFEWVLVPNKEAEIPDQIAADPRVRVIEGARDLDKVGALKRFACEHCRGQAFVELDHDDVLVPGRSLTIIAEQFRRGAGFVYSDSAMFRMDPLRPIPFSPECGWETYPFQVYGRTFLATRAFEPTPRALCEIGFAPDHVRAWSRSAYWKAGGHDLNLEVCDDHDLMAKTYLTGARFQHTGGCHYLYRSYPENTVHTRQAKIREQTFKNRQKYGSPLIREWCRRTGYELLDLREAYEPYRPWTEVCLPLAPKTGWGAVICHDLLQYCPPGLLPDFMDLVYQQLAPGGYLEVVFPLEASRGLHPLAPTQLSRSSFLPYCYRELQPCTGQATKARFQLMHWGAAFPSEFHRREGLHYGIIQLAALKGQRQPGFQTI